MKVKDLLNLIKTGKPNSFSDEMLLGYINEIEAEVQDQMEIVPVTSYDLKLDMDKDLLVKPPYDKLYISYLKARIDYVLEEYENYENDQAQHIADFRDFADWSVRTRAYHKRSPKRFINVF